MLSDFQLVLIAAAAAVVVGVIVYNRWQESRYRRRAEQAFARTDGDQGDALFTTSAVPATFADAPTHTRVEPSFGRMSDADEAAALDKLTAPIGEYLGQQIDDAIIERRPVIHSGAADMQPAINAEIDTIGMILADTPLEADQYAPLIVASQDIARHVLWEGLVGGLWQPIDPSLDEKYRELRAGLQLADRGGAVDIAILQAFDDAIVGYAASLGAVSQREESSEAARRAQIVDAFCAETDIEIAVNIVGKSGVTFAATKLRGLAEAQGLSALPNGEYAQKDDYGRVLFTLRNGNQNEAPALRSEQPYFTQVTFALDVPRTPNAAQNFERMFTLALQFADVLQGEVVDDNKKVLTANGRKSISDTIHDITGEMQQRNIAPGSSVALRLYS